MRTCRRVRSALLTWLCALIWLCASLPARAMPDDTWIVAIGNNRGDADEVSLLYAERDVGELVEVLRAQGGVSSGRARVLRDEDADTVRRSLLEINTLIRSRVSPERRNTALVVLYSGHADARALHLRGTHLALEELRALVSSSPAALRLLVVDACRSGVVTRVKGVQDAPEFAIRMDDRIEAEGVAIIASSTAGEASQESDRLRGSFFSHHLVNALRGAADRDGDGRVTLSEAYSYTYAQTLRSSGRTLALQHPTYSYDVKGTSDLVLTTLSEGGNRSARLRLLQPAQYLISESREGGPLVAELSAPRPRALVALPAGRYFVQQRGDFEYREFQVTLSAGAERDLAGEPFRAVRYDQLVRRRGGTRAYVHGLTALIGGRGEILPGEGPTVQPLLSYHVDLPWLSVGLRLRGSTVRTGGLDLPRRHSEVGVGGVLQRYVDLPWLSVSFGLVIEGVYHVQQFMDPARMAATGHSLGMNFGGLFSAQRALWRGLAAHAEVGPLALVLQRGQAQDGAAAAAGVGAAVTWWLAGGLVWRL